MRVSVCACDFVSAFDIYFMARTSQMRSTCSSQCLMTQRGSLFQKSPWKEQLLHRAESTSRRSVAWQSLMCDK